MTYRHREEHGWEIPVAEALEEIIIRITDAVADDCRRGVPVDTYALHDTIREEYHPDHGRVYVGTEYWASTEYGSREHPITPRSPDGYLHFYWEKEQRWVRTKRVQHPGTPEQPFMRPALYRRRNLQGRAI